MTNFDYDEIIRDQINMLMNRNLFIDDFDFAEEKLKDVSATALVEYGIQWVDRNTGKYENNTTFSDLWGIYLSDRKLKNFLLDYLADIEISLRNIIGSVLSENYGPLGYLNPSRFKDAHYHKLFLGDVKTEINRENESYVHYYREKYGYNFPIYIAVELVSIGTLSKLYANMHRQDQKIVAERYNVKSERVLVSFFYAFTKLRNTCVHHGRLYNRNFSPPCAIYKTDQDRIHSLEPGFTIYPNRLFAGVLAMSHLLNQDATDRMIDDFDKLFAESIQYEKILVGFPNSWRIMLARSD